MIRLNKTTVSGTLRTTSNSHKRIYALPSAIDVKPDDACTIELVLCEKDVPVATFHFDCPR
jgi:hypothetical protein